MDFNELILDNHSCGSLGQVGDLMDIHFSLRIILVGVVLISLLAVEFRRKILKTGERNVAMNSANEIGR